MSDARYSKVSTYGDEVTTGQLLLILGEQVYLARSVASNPASVMIASGAIMSSSPASKNIKAGHYVSASEAPFEWCFAGEPIVAGDQAGRVTFIEIIFSLPLVQVGQLSVTGKSG